MLSVVSIKKMKDKGSILSTTEDMADVEVQCLTVCHDCSVQSLCIGKDRSKGILSVRNPIKACPGDEVMIDVPDTKYSKALIQLFGGLLVTSLLGMSIGYAISSLLSLSPSILSLFGLITGLVLGGIWISHIFRTKNRENLYPVIINIIQKGGCHG